MDKKIEELYKVRGTILLLGETGSGKSFWANKIHQNSSRKNEPFFILNLATIKEELLESELFGHVKGAFTGAIRNKKGILDVVNKGTLFLDEIAELSLEGQKKLLLLLEEKIYMAVGDNKVKKFYGQVICATNKNLSEMVEENNFREDLYYRLRVFSCRVNPIRENKEMLTKMIDYFFEYFKNIFTHLNLSFSKDCYQFLLSYSWPGNIREIKNCMEYVVTMNQSGELKTNSLPPWMLTTTLNEKKQKNNFIKNLNQLFNFGDFPLEYSKAQKEFEKCYFLHVLTKYKGQVNLTAKQIKVSKVTLIAKAKKHAINTSLLRLSMLD